MIARRTTLLARTFFGRLFETDVFSSSVSASNGVVWLLAALATPGVMMSGSQLYFYAHARTFAPERLDRILFVSQAFHVDFAMAVAGLVTMLVWTSLTPDRRDALVLGPLPLGAGEQARARLLALTSFFGMFASAVALPTAVAFTFVTLGESTVMQLVAHIAGHACATLLGAAFMFFALVDVQLLLAAAWGPRAVRAATWPLQAAALLAMVGALAFTGTLADAMLADDLTGNPWVMWNPAAWFLSLYRWVAGDAREVFAILASRALWASGVVIVVALIAYPLAYARCLRHVIAGEGRRASSWTGAAARLWLRGLSVWLRTPLERGLAAFLVATLTRSHTHRFLIGSYLGIGLLSVLPFAGRLLGPALTPPNQYAWFSVPLGLLCWTAAALRVAMMLPVEPGANWVFKLTEPVDKRRVLSTAATVIQAATAISLAAGFGLGASAAGGAALGVLVFAVVLATGLALVELLTLTLRAVPCTCTYRPGQLRLRVWWPVYVLVWLVIAFQLPTIAVRGLSDTRRSAWLVMALLASWAALRIWRLSRARLVQALVYEEADPSVSTTIDLSSARA